MIQASTHAPLVDNLFLTITLIVGAVFLIVIGALFFLGVKYRANSEVDRSSPPVDNLPLEIGWIVVTLLIFIGIFIWGAKLYSTSRAAYLIEREIFVTAKQWVWDFQHESGRREVNELHIPVGQKIKISMISLDVVHSLFIPDFRVKQDILPERYTSLVFEASKIGTYPLLCTQFCGISHSRMLAKIIVMSESDFNHWSNEVLKSTDELVNAGKKLFTSLGCTACHATEKPEAGDEPMVGPSLWNLHGSFVSLKDGSKMKADDNYIHTCIFKPNTYPLSGYEPVMPSFEGIMTEEDFQKVLSYIKSLKGETNHE